MSNDSNQFPVEKILRKRIRNNQSEYLLKWVGCHKNSWEPEMNLDCPDLLNDFEIEQAHKILGKCKKTYIFFLLLHSYAFFQAVESVNGEFNYLMQFKDLSESKLSSIEIKSKWPKMLLDFLQKRVKWIFFKLQTEISFTNAPVITQNPIGEPVAVFCKLCFKFFLFSK